MSPSNVVSMIIRALGYSHRMLLRTSMPLRSGSLRSIKVTSGLCSRKRWIPSLPFAASATMVMSAWALIIAEIPSRTSGWSSTVRMRIADGTLINSSFPPVLILLQLAWLKKPLCASTTGSLTDDFQKQFDSGCTIGSQCLLIFDSRYLVARQFFPLFLAYQ